ncbi:unnamed protein product [Pedinophyceae sp. YPF-701]|nr:unnamed protein product [Pedinophyceae sp. YPF-701]
MQAIFGGGAMLKLTFSQASWARVDILSWPEADPGTDARRDTYRIELEHEASLINTLTGRYFLIDKAKDANIIGILVGTLGAAGFRQVIERIRSLAESAGKKTYTVLVGKPNPAKLANFPEVDIWVMVATGQGMILDNRDYHKKIITPFEAEIAFGAKDWDGSYTLDCRELLEGFKADTPKSHGIQGAELDEADQLDDDEHEDLTTALVQSSERALKIKGNTDAVVGTAAEYYMAKRTWWGVDESAEDDEPPAEIVPGQSGRAVGYENEGNAFRG